MSEIEFGPLALKRLLERQNAQKRSTSGLTVVNADPDRWRLWHREVDGNWAFTDHPYQGEKGTVVRVRCPFGVTGNCLFVSNSSFDQPMTVEIVRVALERLQNISDADVIASGFADTWEFSERWGSHWSLNLWTWVIEVKHRP